MSAVAPIYLSTIVNPTTSFTRTSSATVGYDKTFSPEGWKPNGVMSYVDRSGGVPLGYSRVTFQVRPPTKDSRVYKVSAKLLFPVLETIDPAVGIFGPKVAYELQAHLDVLLPERSTAAERQSFLSLMQSFLVDQVQASDGDPYPDTGTPLLPAIRVLDSPY